MYSSQGRYVLPNQKAEAINFGELTALTWGDIDLEMKTISINKTASSIKNRDTDKKTEYKIVITEPKSKSGKRTIPISKKAEIILHEQKIKHTIFIFASTNDKVLRYRNIQRNFKDTLIKAGLSKEITIHSLRHTFATRLIEKGANIKVISDILGHSTIQITLDTYGHVMPDEKSKAIELLD